jgi:hypothetical protein
MDKQIPDELLDEMSEEMVIVDNHKIPVQHTMRLKGKYYIKITGLTWLMNQIHPNYQIYKDEIKITDTHVIFKCTINASNRTVQAYGDAKFELEEGSQTPRGNVLSYMRDQLIHMADTRALGRALRIILATNTTAEEMQFK